MLSYLDCVPGSVSAIRAANTLSDKCNKVRGRVPDGESAHTPQRIDGKESIIDRIIRGLCVFYEPLLIVELVGDKLANGVTKHTRSSRNDPGMCFRQILDKKDPLTRKIQPSSHAWWFSNSEASCPNGIDHVRVGRRTSSCRVLMTASSRARNRSCEPLFSCFFGRIAALHGGGQGITDRRSRETPKRRKNRKLSGGQPPVPCNPDYLGSPQNLSRSIACALFTGYFISVCTSDER